MEEKKLNIYEKLLMISTELMTVAKNLEVGVGQNKYKAVGEADVLKAVKPLEAKYKVYSYPVNRSIIESGTIESTTFKGEVKKNLFERIEVVYRFVNVENPSEYIDITSYGDGIDSQDKSVGKAMTYADKYALLKAYKIITGDDPDQEASQELRDASTKKTTKKNEINEVVLLKAQKLNIKLEDVATYFKKKVTELTNEEVVKAIDLKEKQIARLKEKQAKQGEENGTLNI